MYWKHKNLGLFYWKCAKNDISLTSSLYSVVKCRWNVSHWKSMENVKQRWNNSLIEIEQCTGQLNYDWCALNESSPLVHTKGHSHYIDRLELTNDMSGWIEYWPVSFFSVTDIWSLPACCISSDSNEWTSHIIYGTWQPIHIDFTKKELVVYKICCDFHEQHLLRGGEPA